MKIVTAAALLALPLLAQSPDWYRKHYFSVGGGAGLPGGDIKPLLDPSPAFRFNYGYRFHRYFQADAGIDTVFYAARVRDFYESDFGDLRIKDYQFFVPMGGRAIVPLMRNRVLLSAGGGGPYMRYQERVRQPFGDNFRIDCPVCRARDGWGYYGLVGASVAIDRAQMIRLGFSTRVYRADVAGQSIGAVPAIQTRDSWTNSAIEVTFSF